MDVHIDVNNRLVCVNEKHYSLDKFEDYILKYWEPLCAKNFVKAIQSKGQTVYVYDWSKIFDQAITGSVILEGFLEKEGAFKNVQIKLKQSNLFD